MLMLTPLTREMLMYTPPVTPNDCYRIYTKLLKERITQLIDLRMS